MRSRYSAYALQQIDYLVATTHPDQRGDSLRESIAAWARVAQFVGLSILSSRQGGKSDKVGKVEFVAEFVQQGLRQRLHETSRFRRYQGKWHYVDGVVQDES